ncbi:Zn-dependent protease with chaperone function [Verrucomicrobium sp. GAS474]|uniref:M48 family metallopeptidase n=1 Tax=Verrucomicrobium sp. GAS474 TaxID=1882831 RepID=UPI00087D8C1F|nr:M48 family metallopeptidase [Verrucomicrobium sp. GAS474]SDU03904.1 Zn-dependent protease with chaperone function [Verrucomicrobium sp. GAS474]
MPISLTPETLTLPKEKTYFQFALAISILAWIAVAITIIGIPYAIGAAIALFMANGLLIAKLRSESVEVTPEQLPQLHATHLEVCRTLGLTDTLPSLYVLQSGGILNAFATRHSGRNFVVVNSSFLEALGEATPEMKFLLGHEIGHLKRNHLFKRALLLPAHIVPLLGHAYSRACEATCDRHGALAAGEAAPSTRALLVLAAGKDAAPKANPPMFAGQHHRHRGFFISWHELNSGYPTLSQRVSNILALEDPQFLRPVKRNPLAYFFSAFVSVQMGVFLYIAILAAIAFPAFQKAQQQALGMKAKQAHRRASDGPVYTPTEPVIIPALPSAPPPQPPPPAPASDAPPEPVAKANPAN